MLSPTHRYRSSFGQSPVVNFETAVLMGKPADGGLFVPEALPQVSQEQLMAWKDLSYPALATELLQLFIDEETIPKDDLIRLVADSFGTFLHPEIIPHHPLPGGIFVQELFHGPTLSFKDVAMGFVVNLFNFFLKKRGQKMSIVVATTGDTGPAAAHASVGKETLNTWVLYPKELITEEQERQMTTLFAANVHPVGVYNCPDGADDLDLLIAELFADTEFKKQLNLSSVNSINWGRVMMQTVHYFYGYLQLVDRVGELVNFAVPSGAFGNLCAGSLARLMGLPVGKFIIANNQNACLTRIFTEGLFEKRPIIGCPSSAIDILIPYNFWRYLYFAVGQDSTKIKAWIAAFEETGKVQFDSTSFQQYSRGYLAHSVSDKATLKTIQSVFEAENYLLDPHAAVAVAAADKMAERLEVGSKTLCLATAHPCKFPESIRAALSVADSPLPKAATHPSVEKAKQLCQKGYHVDYSTMRTGIRASMLASVR